jgi:ankyrin repeat protein
LSYDAVQFLLNNIEKQNLLLNNTDKLGNTALHYLMEDNNMKLSVELIKLGAKYDIKNGENSTCFDLVKDENLKKILLNFINGLNNN